MKMTEIKATNLEIPYAVEYRPALQPGIATWQRITLKPRAIARRTLSSTAWKSLPPQCV